MYFKNNFIMKMLFNFTPLLLLLLITLSMLPKCLIAFSLTSENNSSNIVVTQANQQIESNQQISTSSTLDVLYMVPDELDVVYNLNEKDMLGNGVTNGWILPADEPITLNLYLYYDGTDEKKT